VHVIVVRFLGTGPAGGRPGRGRSHRRESSLAVSSDAGTILIDVGRDAATQLRSLDSIDLVLLTHAHRDASGGLPVLERRARSQLPIFASRDTVRRLRARHPRLTRVELHAVTSRATFAWRDWRITPLSVPHARDCATFAWRLDGAGCSIVYASDVARLTRGLRELADRCDLLVLDGAMWQRTIFTHLEIQATAPIVATWPVRRVLFTQLGRSTPKHEVLDAWLRAFDPRFAAAYDGLELSQ
jgi:phosphoribosyl 1,2-cyclic phosphodiesterase